MKMCLFNECNLSETFNRQLRYFTVLIFSSKIVFSYSMYNLFAIGFI